MSNTDDRSTESIEIEVELANQTDISLAEAGAAASSAVRRIRIRGTASRRITRLVLPASIADQLGLEICGTTLVRYPDGRTAERPLAHHIRLTYSGRHGIHRAIIEPDRESALLGVMVLDDLDFLIDPIEQRLVPRDSRYIISEVE
jgi:hypothetical protein